MRQEQRHEAARDTADDAADEYRRCHPIRRRTAQKAAALAYLAETGLDCCRGCGAAAVRGTFRAMAETKAQVATTGRTTYSAIIFNADAFVAAAVTGGFGIPADCLMPNPVKLNEYARSLRERIDAWPGVRLSKKTSL